MDKRKIIFSSLSFIVVGGLLLGIGYKKGADSIKVKEGEIDTLKKKLANSQAMCQNYQKEINRQTDLLKDKVFGANLSVYKAMPEDEVRKLWLKHTKMCDFSKLKAIQGARGKIPIKYTDKRNRTALHYAAIRGHLILLKNLGNDLMPPSQGDQGCNIKLFRIPDSNGRTVLDIAIEEKDYRAVDYIYEKLKGHKVDYKEYLSKYSGINIEEVINKIDSLVKSQNITDVSRE